MSVSVPGVISGINTTKLIQQLTQAYQAPINQLKSQVAQENADLTAWGNFKGALSQLQSGMSSLSDINSVGQRSASSSDTSVATVTADNSAIPGSYSVSVSALAQAQSVYSQAFASSSQTTIGTGTIGIQVGSGAVVNVSITNSNDTLAGIAGAINGANAGVKATVIYDGSGYRLALTGSKTGAANAFSVSVSNATGNLSSLNYNATTKNMTQSAAAQDAKATVNGISVTSTTNTVSGAVPGLSLDLLQAGSTTVAVNQDVSGVVKAVNGFVTAFNGAMSTINNLTKYDSGSGQAGPLLGNPQVQSIRTRMLDAISGFGQGVPLDSQYNGLGSVGISINKDGTIALDSGALTKALNNDFSGVAGLFGRVGSTTGAGIEYVSSADTTQPGTYAVNVNSPATQASVVGASAVPTSGIASSETLTIVSGSSSANVMLASGSTISTIVNAVNSTLTQNGMTSLTAVNDGGSLKIFSNEYGSNQTFSVVSNLSAPGQSGIGTSKLTGSGSDVSGTVNGEPVTATGQTATVTGGGPADGLALKITGATTGDIGTVSLSSGLYQQLNPMLTQVLDPNTGSVVAATKSINDTITGLNKRITGLQQNLQSQTQLLQEQFNQMEQTMAQLQQTGNYLSAFFGSSQGSSGGSSSSSTSGSSGG